MKNIVQKATCFAKITKATLIDLFLTCQECDFKKVCNFGTGIGDVHNNGFSLKNYSYSQYC